MNDARKFASTRVDQDILNEVEHLAARLQFVGADLALQAQALAESLATGELSRWMFADLYTIFDVDNFEVRIRGNLLKLRYVVLVLYGFCFVLGILSILYTGINLWGALINYGALDSSDLPQFLSAWEGGFTEFLGIDLPFTYRLSQVVAFDLLLLIEVAVLYVIARTVRWGGDLYVERAARELRIEACAALNKVIRFLSQQRYLETINSAVQFRESSQSLLAHLDAAQRRAGELVDKREREAKDLTLFSHNLVSSTESLLHLAKEIKAAYQAFESTASSLQRRVEDIATHQDYRALRVALSQEQEARSVMVERLRDLVNSNDALVRDLDGFLKRLDATEYALRSTMHLGAQIVDDYEQRGMYERSLSENLKQIQQEIEQSTAQLLQCNVGTRSMLETLPQANEDLANTWKQAGKEWIAQHQSVVDQVAEVLQEQGANLANTGQLVSEGLQQLESEYAKAQKTIMAQQNFYNEQLKFQFQSISQASEAIKSSVTQLVGVLGKSQ